MESFYFLRHGQTDWNAQGLLMGQTDIPLNEIGRKLALEAAKKVVGHAPATICYSPLSRTKETAMIIADECPCNLHAVDGLAERSWAEWEGTVALSDQLGRDDENIPSGAERHEAFETRVLEAFKQSLSYPQPVLIVSHSGVLRLIYKELGVVDEGSQPFLIHFFQQLGKWHVEVMMP